MKKVLKLSLALLVGLSIILPSVFIPVKVEAVDNSNYFNPFDQKSFEQWAKSQGDRPPINKLGR